MPILTAKHIRQHRSPDDGDRILVMRRWPRGVRREAVDSWLRDLAPSTDLLREFRETGSDPAVQLTARGDENLWSWFTEAYRAEISAQAPLTRGVLEGAAQPASSP